MDGHPNTVSGCASRMRQFLGRLFRSKKGVGMGMIVAFSHARASKLSEGVEVLAAKATNNSAVRPSVRAFSVARTADHQSLGMLRLCHHFETADAPAPTSEAIASRDSHSSITDRNEFTEVIENHIGQTVLTCKDKMPSDCGNEIGQTVPMAKSVTPPAFKRAFTANTRAARKLAGLTQAQMAQRLGIGGQDDYKPFEGRSLLPHRLIPLFCQICGIQPNDLFTGQIPKSQNKPNRPKAA